MRARRLRGGEAVSEGQRLRAEAEWGKCRFRRLSDVAVLSVFAWYVPDTSYSLLSGYWQNALLNTVFLALFAVPLLATRGRLRNDA